MEPDMIEKATMLLRSVAGGDPVEAIRHVSPDRFIRHDPRVGDGVAGLQAQVSPSAGNDGLQIVRTLEDGHFVVVHGRAGIDDGEEVFFAVFRFEGGLVVEHWRVAAPAVPPNASGHTQTDGPAKSDIRQETRRVKALVRDYYETVHIGGRHGGVGQYMSGDWQVRHELGVRDGVAAFERDLAVLTRSKTIDEIVLLIGQGDLVFIVAKGTHEGEPCAYVDLYRVEADRLVEHWGFPQAIPQRDVSKNSNGLL